jgi:hypothetical protein
VVDAGGSESDQDDRPAGHRDRRHRPNPGTGRSSSQASVPSCAPSPLLGRRPRPNTPQRGRFPTASLGLSRPPLRIRSGTWPSVDSRATRQDRRQGLRCEAWTISRSLRS